MLYRSVEYKDYPYSEQLRKAHKVSCLNRIPRGHKFYTYARLLEKSYDSILSFNGLTDSNSNQSISYDDPWYYDLPREIKEQLKDVPRYKQADDSNWINDLTPLHPAYTDCYLNVVTETSSKTSFYSEKICKPLTSAQFFLMSSGKDSLDGLRVLGFDCFDDIFQDHRYVRFDNCVERIDSMIEIFDSVYDNLEHLYSVNYARLLSNRNYFLSEDFKNRLLAPLEKMGVLDK
jgi:hypothetical protein